MKFRGFERYFVLGIAVLAVVALASSLAGAASKSDSTIGYVDMERLQNELPDFLKLKETIKDKQAEFNYYRGYLYQQQQTAAKELEKKATADKAGKNTDEQAAIDKRYQDDVKKKTDELSGLLQQKGSEIEKYINDQKNAAMDNVNKIIAEVAGEKKLTMVLDKSARYFGGIDITQAVIDKAKKNEEAAKTGKDKKTDKK
ncbi:MAG: OmpH family outer membrane protein [Bacillota bacterium]